MNYFGFIYEWIDSTNDKNYVGSHKGSINDGYIGSGKLFKLAYNKRSEKFKREILEYVYENNREKLLEVEQKYLDNINWNNTYNLVPNARGGTVKGSKQSEEHRRNNSESHKGQVPWNKGKTGLQIAWNIGLPGNFLGREHKIETRKNMSEIAKLRPRVKCPYCNKIGQQNAMMKHHFDRCKFKELI